MTKRILTEADIIPNADYAKISSERRTDVSCKKWYRRIVSARTSRSISNVMKPCGCRCRRWYASKKGDAEQIPG